jgi:hypothetical protein
MEEALLARLRDERLAARAARLPIDGDGPPRPLPELPVDDELDLRLRSIIARQAAEIARLRALTSVQQSQIAQLTEELRQVREAALTLAAGEALEAVLAAIARADAALPGMSVASARAEVKAGLSIADGGVGLSLEAPLQQPEQALSTFAVELRSLPEGLDEQRLRTAQADIGGALQSLQRALEDVAGGETALAAASALLDAPPAAEALGAAMQPLATAVRRLAVEREPLAAPAVRLDAALAAAQQRTGSAELAVVADVTLEVAQALRAG